MFKRKCKSSESELSAEEVKKAEIKRCKWVQEEVYKEDYQLLKSGQTLPKNSRLLKLDPYYDREDQVIRVGGRLQFADLLEHTGEPRFNEPQFNEVLDITNDILCPSQSYSKMHGIEPRYKEPRYNEFFDIANIMRKPKRKIYLDITNYNVNTRQKINAEQINSQQIL